LDRRWREPTALTPEHARHDGPELTHVASNNSKYPDLSLFCGKGKRKPVSCRILRRSERYTSTTFRSQKVQDTVHRRIIHPVEHLAPPFFLKDKAGVDEGRQMVRESRRRQLKKLSNVTDTKPIVPRLHKESEDREAGVMTECGKRASVGADCVHTLTHNHISSYVNG